MTFEKLTKNEKLILLTLRRLQAHERLEIMADQKGREDYYVVRKIETKPLTEILT